MRRDWRNRDLANMDFQLPKTPGEFLEQLRMMVNSLSTYGIFTTDKYHAKEELYYVLAMWILQRKYLENILDKELVEALDELLYVSLLFFARKTYKEEIIDALIKIYEKALTGEIYANGTVHYGQATYYMLNLFRHHIQLQSKTENVVLIPFSDITPSFLTWLLGEGQEEE